MGEGNTSDGGAGQADVSAVLALEAARCAAVNAHDMDRLASLLHDDYVHVHATGQVDDRTRAIEGFSSIPRQMTRGPLTVRIAGDIAIIVGRQFNVLRIPGRAPMDVVIRASQVARRDGRGWRFLHFHASKIGPID